MPHPFYRQLQKTSNTAFTLANGVNGLAVTRNEGGSNNRTYIESRINDNGRFGAVTRNFVYTGTVYLSSGTVANVESVIQPGSLVLGVTARVTSNILAAGGFHIGYAGQPNAFANSIANTSSVTSDMTKANTSLNFPILFTSTSNVMISSNSATAFAGGNVRVAVHGIRFDPPNT